MKPEILLINPVLPVLDAALTQRYTLHRYYQQTDKDACIAAVGAGVRGVVSGGSSGLGTALMAKLPALEVVAVNGIGTDAVDLAQARERGIHVSTTPGVLTDDVADLAIALLLAACRGLSSGERFVREGHWRAGKPALPLARRFSGMRVGIVGLGRVGRAIATRAAAFGCPISYTDLRAIDGVPYTFVADLAALARDSDALILAASADQGGAIVNGEILDALGPSGYLINIARGKLVDEADLVQALQDGRIAGAGLDVFADEPHVPEALLAFDNVALQPHRASATVETRTDMGNLVLESLEAAFAGRRPATSVTT
ncbi:2-hydroxyacid dehydrogenase [Robbsia sp. Bb-Pol-6]|uniref:2-hydroxyacid dehydrogenase n=1 Tax=Robbsia betulipollinis TaxID=2981849 RepID=A0ABT3ZR54_9BURK|nr:2-hydroxyacid dehydrogenase [Robbsia betulipollinis]MCY0389039.1 2-hydroxyacid dehydrogenase [Robbsia betulipollinis]